MDVMQHWNLLDRNCLGFFSDTGYLLLRGLKKVGLADRYADIEGKSTHPAGLIEVSLKKNGKGLSGHIVLPALRSGTFVWGEQQLNLVGGRNTIAHLFPLAN